MFSGIIESNTSVLNFIPDGEIYKLVVRRPDQYDDLNPGDSISNDGVCLTVESFDEECVEFAVGLETLKVTGWNNRLKAGSKLNLERSLRFGDRVHGHLVTGHVDGTAVVRKAEIIESVMNLDIELSKGLEQFVWPKGSIAINGVSLTVNAVTGRMVSVHLIPETLKRTNLAELKVEQVVNIEVDNMARGLVWKNGVEI